ncbi:MAG: UDP-N-acetylmuramoyl-L-alanine--D-glutamate ligase [Patescibacteria group bacterium]
MDLSKIENFQDAIVTVMGLGRYTQGSGLGATKWLMRHGAQTVITDLKTDVELKESVDLVMEWYNKYREQFPNRTIYQPLFILGQHRVEDFVNVDCVVQNPGVPSESEFVKAAREKGVAIESDVSLFFRYYKHPIIAVTGTKGKTTTTMLTGAMLAKLDPKAVIAGNVKISPLEALDEMLVRPDATPVVVELSSWLLESLPVALTELKKGPDIAVFTNVFPDHLNRYASYEDYIKSKEIIFEHQTPEQFTILNFDNDIVRAMEPRVKGKLFWCSKTYQDHDGCYVKDGSVVFRRDGTGVVLVPLASVGLQGEHNLENVLTSACAALLRGVAVVDVQEVLQSFKGVDDRQELVREVDEITYINDTTATAPDAVVAALKRFGVKDDVILIAGGVDKKMDFASLIATIPPTCKKLILFPGDASDIIEAGLAGKVDIDHAKSMKEAVQKARAAAVTGDIVLLSPGAASFNMFKNEFDRGEQFREEVRTL